MSPFVGCPGPGGFLSGGAFVRGSFARGHFWPGGFLSGGAFVRGVFCPGGLLPGGRLSGGLTPVPPSSMRIRTVYAFVPSIVAWRTNKKTDKLGPVAPREVDPAPQIFRVCRGGGTLHISSKHYMGPTPFYGARAEKNPKSRFCHETNEYMSS